MLTFSAWLNQQPYGINYQEAAKTYDALVTTDTHMVGDVDLEKLVNDRGTKVLEMTFSSSSSEHYNKYKSISILSCAILNRAKIKNFDSLVLTLLGFGVSVDRRDTSNGSTPLHLISRTFYLLENRLLKISSVVCDKLVSASKDINAQDEDGQTALFRALLNFPDVEKNSCWDFIASLLAKGADPLIMDKSGETVEDALMYRAKVNNRVETQSEKCLAHFREYLKKYNVNINVDVNRMAKDLPDLATAIKSEGKILESAVENSSRWTDYGSEDSYDRARHGERIAEAKRERLIKKIEKYIDWSKQTGKEITTYLSPFDWHKIYCVFENNVNGDPQVIPSNVAKIFEVIPYQPEPPVYSSYQFRGFIPF